MHLIWAVRKLVDGIRQVERMDEDSCKENLRGRRWRARNMAAIKASK
jgi:hypothetical protein